MTIKTDNPQPQAVERKYKSTKEPKSNLETKLPKNTKPSNYPSK